jgi:hypothetical protein
MKTLLLAAACAVALAAPSQAQEKPPLRELVEEAMYVWDCALSLRGAFSTRLDQCQQAWQSAPADRRQAVVKNLNRSGGPDRQFTVLMYDCIDEHASIDFSAFTMEERGRITARCLKQASRQYQPKPPAL